MNQSDFWKNFQLGTEIDVSGSFIFNGLRRLHEMDSLYHESDIFEVLYNLAVGIERLFKVAIILIEHDASSDQNDFEESLITHTHQELLRRIRERHDVRLAAVDNEFIDMLGAFYKTHRYGRYAVSSVVSGTNEKQLLHQFVSKHLGIEILDEFPFRITPLDSRIRTFIEKRVAKTTKRVFSIINEEATRLHLHTYELRSNSKAEKVFLSGQIDFCDEDVLWKELLLFFLNSDVSTGMIGFMKSIEPLPFDPALAVEYLGCFVSNEHRSSVLGELECLYSEVEDVKGRLAMLDVIGRPNVFFDDEEDGFDCDSDESWPDDAF